MKRPHPPMKFDRASDLIGGALIDEINTYYSIQHSPDIEVLSNQEIRSYEFLNDFVAFTKQIKDRIVVPCIPYETGIGLAVRDIELGLSFLKKSSDDIIPYAELLLPDEYDCMHGSDYKHIFLFFITKYNDFNQSCEHVNYLLNKFKKYKTFL